MSNDINISATNRIPVGGVLLSKPSYLIVLQDGTGKTKTYQYFITLDRPEFMNGFIQVKGMYDPNNTEDVIIKNYADILTTAEKDLYCELFLPTHRICEIRSLVFKAK
jgi:hypothetical protein